MAVNQPASICICPNHPTLFMSHKAEGTEYIFRYFSVKSQSEGFLYCSSPPVCNQKIALGPTGRAAVGRAFCVLVFQEGTFAFFVHKHACYFF